MDRIKRANELMRDALKRIELNGAGIVKASADGDPVRVAVKWEAMTAANHDLQYALDELHQCHELGPLIHPEDDGEFSYCYEHGERLSEKSKRRINTEERRDPIYSRCSHVHITGKQNGLVCDKPVAFIGMRKSAREITGEEPTPRQMPGCFV